MRREIYSPAWGKQIRYRMDDAEPRFPRSWREVCVGVEGFFTSTKLAAFFSPPGPTCATIAP